jgi:hypothetical protein
MQEVKAPEQFQFTKQGQVLAGVLIRIEPTVIKGKDAIEYMLEGENRQRMTCLGTADLNKKINPGHIGHWLEIRYATDDSSFQKEGQSPMRVFEVKASKEREPGFEAL